MSTDTAEAREQTTESEGNGRKRGGPRGPRQWKDRPTARERVLTQSLSAFVKKETGRDVSPETCRAVRHSIPRWWGSEDTQKLRDNMDRRLERAKLQDKREKALAMLREADSELAKFAGATEVEEDEEDEDEEDESPESGYDEESDETDDEEDVFGDSGEKVNAQF